MIWVAVLGGSISCFALKLLGYVIPERFLAHPNIMRVTALIPVAFLAALMPVQTLIGGDGQLVIDARLAGMLVALIALILRVPFLGVIVLASVTAALTRATGLMP
jgi:hypothetical protein